MSYQVFSQNGKILPMNEATVPLTKIEYAYGFGVYENIRVVRGSPLFVDDHVERLFLSAKVIGLSHEYEKESVKMWITDLVKKVGDEACNLKMLLIGGKEPNLSILPLKPLFPDKKLYKTGASATLAEYERQFPNAKSLNMLGSFVAYRDAKESGAYDALLLNRKNEITEGTRTNFFLIEGNTIVSAPENEILHGVTMKYVLKTATEQGMTIVYEPITVERVQKADGAFLTSTSSKIMPLSRIGEIELTIPENLKKLMEAFKEFLFSHHHNEES